MSERPTPQDLRHELASLYGPLEAHLTHGDPAAHAAGTARVAIRRALHAEAHSARLEQALRRILTLWGREFSPGATWQKAMDDARAALGE